MVFVSKDTARSPIGAIAFRAKDRKQPLPQTIATYSRVSASANRDARETVHDRA